MSRIDFQKTVRLTLLAGIVTTAYVRGTPAANADDPVELLPRLTGFEAAVLHVPPGRPEQLNLSVPIDGVSRDLVLSRVSVWAPDAKVLVHRAGGIIDQIDPPPVNTYRGHIPGLPGSVVTAALKSDGFHSIVRLPEGEVWEVAPLDGLGIYAVHRAADFVRPLGHCSVSDEPDAPDDLQNALPDLQEVPTDPAYAGGPEGEGSSTHVAELLLECDVEYYLWNGGVIDSLEEMALVINNVNEVYERDVNITHVLTYIIVHTEEADPYTTSYGPSLLNQFAAQLTTYPPEWFDLALLFTDKDTWDDGGSGLLGLAHIGRVCQSSTGLASGFSEAIGNDTSQADVVAHELGHIWNARHCDTDPECAGQQNPCLTMCGTLDGCDGELEFGPCATSRIIAHRDDRSCLEPGTNGIQWVRWRACGFGCPEDGDFEDPHNTLAEAVADSASGGTIMIFPGASGHAGGDETFPLIIDKAVTIRPYGEGAIIGN